MNLTSRIEEASSAQNQELTEETSERESGENNWPLQLEQPENNPPPTFRGPGEQRRSDQRLDEIELITRERDLMRREIELTRRELKLLRNSPASIQPQQPPRHVNVNNIKDMMSDFGGSEINFRNWKKKFQLLCTTYELDDANGQLLVSLKLKGKALKWLHSKSEYIGMTLPNLLIELGNMFDHRHSKLDLRKKF